MAQTILVLGRKGCCGSFGFYERQTLSSCGKYDLNLRRALLADYEEPNTVELRVAIGKQMVSKLPAKFKKENNGRFVAMTYTGKILAICNTLESLNSQIVKTKVKENYYIDRLGYSEIAQI